MSRPTLVVPCYNEALRLPVIEFARSMAQPRGPRLLFVNDGSRDETSSLLDELASRNPARASVLNLATNRGKAEAVRHGILQAFATGATVAGFWDADLATPLDELTRLEEALVRRPELEMVIGSRISLLGNSIQRDPLRHGLGRVVAGSIGWTLGLQVHDTQCGAKLFRSTATMKSIFSVPFITRWLFDVEILARIISLNRAGKAGRPEAIALELPLGRWDHVGGSKVKPADFFRAFHDLTRIWRATLAPGAAFIPAEGPQAAPDALAA